MMENTSESTVCSVFETYPYVIVATVSACSGIVSALCCIFVICLVFLLKKHYFFIQRIILYHCLAALFRALSVILHFHRIAGYDTESTAQDTLCIISGFTSQLTLWILIVDYSIITFTLLMSAVFHKNVAHLERLYVVLIFILPLTFNWIPFIGNSYGLAGLWCWIRNVNYDDCTQHHLGKIFRDVLWHVPFFGLLFVMIPTYLLTIAYVARQRFCKLEKYTKMSQDTEVERLRKHTNEEVWSILFFPFGVVFCNLFIFIDTFYSFTNTDPSYVIWILHGIFGELQGGYIALVYVLDRDTLKRLTYSNVKAAITRVKRDTVYEYPTEDGGGTVSDSAVHSPETDYRQHKDNSS